MYKIQFVQHNDLSRPVLDEIIAVKSVAWPYTYEKQTEWINKNMKNTDVHVLLKDGNNLIAYLNLIDIDLEKDSQHLKGFGIGNVCAASKGQGWGKELMLHVNRFLEEQDTAGLLFCKDRLVKFYTECGWDLVPQEKLQLNSSTKEIFTFCYNFQGNFNSLKYGGILF